MIDREEVSYYAYRLAGALAPRIPPPLAYRLATPLGTVLHSLSPSRRHVEANISHIVGEPVSSPRVQRLARGTFRNQCKNYFDLFRAPALSSDDIRRAVTEVSGLEHLDRGLSRGRGVVLVSAHFGNIDVAGQILALLGLKVTALAEHLRPERLFQYVCRARESHGLRFIPIDGSLRPAFRALRANEIVASALDRNVTDNGRLVEFLGQPACLPDGYLKLALHTGAALVPVFCHRRPDDTFSIVVEPETRLEPSGDLERDTAAGLPQVLSAFTRHLSRWPDQWVLFQPVWPSQARAPDEGAAATGRAAYSDAEEPPGARKRHLNERAAR